MIDTLPKTEVLPKDAKISSAASKKLDAAPKEYKTMPFPRHYKKLLMRGKKDTTIRILNERCVYKKNHTYQATDYRGNHWPVLIDVKEIFYVRFKDIKKLIPDAELKAKEFKKLKDNAKVEVVKFKCRQK